MSFVYLYITILAMFVIWKMFLFIFRGGNFYLIPTNIARTYKTVKNKFNNKYEDDIELLFIAGMINAKIYIKKNESLIEEIYFSAKSCGKIRNEVIKISNFTQMLMQKYFLLDSKMSYSEIEMAITEKMEKIDKTISRELKSKKYFSENVIEKDIPIVKKYYSRFKKIKIS